MHVLAMRNYKALENIMNYPAAAVKRTAEVFTKAQKPLSTTNFKPIASDSYISEKGVEMSAPVFAQFLRLFIG